MSDKLKYTNKDYQSILKNLIDLVPELSKAYDPQSESDPAAFLLKDMALLGDMLSFYLDKQALETAPSTMTQRKVADAFYRMMDYYMSWYRPAKARVTFHNENTRIVRLPKYTTLKSVIDNTEVVLLGEVPLPPSANTTEDIYAYEGTVITDEVGDITDHKFKMSPSASRIYIESVQVKDTSGSIWTRVEDIEKHPQLGQYYDVYADDLDNIYLRFSPYIDKITSKIKTVTYLVSRGEGSTIVVDSFKDAIIKIPDNIVDMSAEGISVIFSNASEESTKGPETPAEAFKNSQLYMNTADTLITVKDYQNAIRRIFNISNCVVTDRVSEEVIGTTPLPDSLTYIVRWVYKNFSYGDMTSEQIGQLIDSYLSELKCVNLTAIPSLDYYLMVWQPTGTLTLSEPISQSEADALLQKICRKLAEDYHPSNMEFGEGVSLVDIVNSIKSYDDRIYLVDIKPIKYAIRKPDLINGDVNGVGAADEAIINLYRDYINGTGLAPTVYNSESNLNYPRRHWTKYNSYNSDSSANINSGLRVDTAAPAVLNNVYAGVNDLATELSPLSSGSLELDPIDFFNEYHPYKKISIPMFANYRYLSGDVNSLNEFKSNVKINKESIK